MRQRNASSLIEFSGLTGTAIMQYALPLPM
jgi:hypothetical protein